MRVKKAFKKTISLINETAVQIYENYVGQEIGFLLESYDKSNGRYVFIGKEPEEIISSIGSQGILIKKKSGKVERREGNPVTLLKQYYNEFDIRKEPIEFPFSGGLVGAFGYDYARYSENLPQNNLDEIGVETIQLMLVTEFFCMDHASETLTAICYDEDSKEGEANAAKRLDNMLSCIKNGLKKETKAKLIRDGKLVKQSDNQEEYGKKVKQIQKYIKEGHVFQTVLSQRWTIETMQSGFNMYKELRVLNPSPYMYYFHFGEFEIIGSSPEMIVKESGGKVQTCPIAGTRKRGKTKEEDEALRKELLDDPKEKAEHVMLVDLARNDMGRIAEFGTVKVTQYMKVQNYSHVMHIVSMVEGRKKKEYHPCDLLTSFLPAGTLSGAPKIRAMEIIDELEDSQRGLYGGAVGYIDFAGNEDFCITIRTMIKKGNKVYLQAGAGIVADSVPQLEYEECCNKVKALATLLVEEDAL